jgi:hypothetical protein
MIDEDEDEKNEEQDVEEASGAGGVGGYTTPLKGSFQDLEDMRKIGFGAKF